MLRRLLAGLFAVIVALSSATEAPAALMGAVHAPRHAMHGMAAMAHNAMPMSHQNSVAPGSDNGCHEGMAGFLPGCCAVPIVWLPANSPAIVPVFRLRAIYLTAQSHNPAGIGTVPALPPPRRGV